MLNFPFLNKEIAQQSWVWLVLRGVLAFIFAIMLVFFPIAAVVTLSWVWGIFIFVDGIFCVMAGWKMRDSVHSPWGYILWGVFSMLAGLVASLYPGITALVLLTIIAFWAVFSGIAQIMMGFKSRHDSESFWQALLFGVIAILFGVMLFTRPLEGAVAIAWIIAFFACISGTFFISMGLKLRKMTRS